MKLTWSRRAHQPPRVPPVASPTWKRAARHATVPAVALAAIGTLWSVASPRTSAHTTVLGVPITISVEFERPVRSGVARYNIPAPLPCPVALAFDPDVFSALGVRNTTAYVLAHEIGHCLDYRLLSGSHGGITGDTGYGTTQDVMEAEAYADAYASAYLARCGNLLSPLGWPSATPDGTCSPPDPRDVVTNGQPRYGVPGEHLNLSPAVTGGTNGTVLQPTGNPEDLHPHR